MQLQTALGRSLPKTGTRLGRVGTQVAGNIEPRASRGAGAPRPDKAVSRCLSGRRGGPQEEFTAMPADKLHNSKTLAQEPRVRRERRAKYNRTLFSYRQTVLPRPPSPSAKGFMCPEHGPKETLSKRVVAVTLAPSCSAWRASYTIAGNNYRNILLTFACHPTKPAFKCLAFSILPS